MTNESVSLWHTLTNWEALLDPALYMRLCLALVHSLWLATIIAAIVIAICHFGRRWPAHWKYSLHVAGLLTCLCAFPATLLVLHGNSTRDNSTRGNPTPIVAARSSAASSTPVRIDAARPHSVRRPPENPAAIVVADRESVASPSTIERPATPPRSAVAVTLPDPAPAAGPPSHADVAISVVRDEDLRSGVLPSDASPNGVFRSASVVCCVVYGLGVLAMLVRLGTGIRVEQRLCRNVQTLNDGPAVRFVTEGARRWSMRVVPAVASAQHIVVPKVVGLVRPMILLPAAIAGELSVDELEMVLVHELSHVRRYDAWVSLLQRLVECVLFFNPAVWFLSRRVSILREYCCDDLVCSSLAAGGPPASVRYAQALLHVAELSCARAQLAMLKAAMGHQGPLELAALGRGPSELKRRIARLLGESLPRPLGLSRGGVAMLASLVVAVLAGPVAWSAAEPKDPSSDTAQGADTAQQAGRDRYADTLPAGAESRLGTVRFRPGTGVEGIAFSHDGSIVICTERDDAAISLWNVKDGQLIRRLQANASTLKAMDVSADGKRIAAGGFRFDPQQSAMLTSLDVWELATGKKVTEIARNERDECAAVKFLPDGSGLLGVGRSGKFQIFDLSRGVAVKSETIRQARASGAALSPDGTKAAMATNKGVYIWDSTSALPPHRVGDGQRVESITYSPDGATLALCLGWDTGVRLIDATTGDAIKPLLIRRRQSNLQSVSYSPDGKLIAATSSSDYGVQIWDVGSGERVRLLEMSPRSPSCVAFSRDSRLAAASGADGVISVWNVATGEELSKVSEAHHDSVAQISFVDDQRVVTSADDGSIRAWDAATGKQQFAGGHAKWARGLAVSHDGKLVASSGMDDTVRLWDAETGREILNLPGHGKYGGQRPVAFTADDKQFVSWGDNLYLRVWDTKTGKAVAEHLLRPTGVPIPADPEEPPPASVNLDSWLMHLQAAVFSPDAQTLVLAIGQSLHVFDAKSGQEARTIGVDEGTPNHLAISPDGKRLLATTSGPQIKIKLADGGARQPSSGFQVIRLWNLETGELALKFNVQGDSYGPVAYSPDGRLFATATRMGFDSARPRRTTIRVWDASSNTELKMIDDIPSVVRALAFSPSNNRLGAAMADTTALVWKLDIPPGKK